MSATDLTAAFTAPSSDPDSTLSAWNWDFGDGATSTQPSPSHTYSAASDYTVSLIVTDNDGAADTVVQSVSPSAPVSVTSISPNSISVGSTTVVTVAGSGFSPGAALVFENGTGPAPIASDIVVQGPGLMTATISVRSGGPKRNR